MKTPFFFLFFICMVAFGIFTLSSETTIQSIPTTQASVVTTLTVLDMIPSPTELPIQANKTQKTKVPTKPTTPPLSGPNASVQTSPTPRLSTPAVSALAQPFIPVRLETLTLFSRYLGGAERIAQIYLPGAYFQNPSSRFKVMYAFDGQQLPEIGFQQTLNEMFAAGEIEPVIVVAVFSTEGDFRKEELGAGTFINSFGWGTSSEAFNQFMVNELVPKVNNSYRTLTGAKNTAIMGWSLGGLTSFYLAWQYPDVFGTVGAFSPSFWWRTESDPGKELQARVIPNIVQAGQKRDGLRMWFEAGSKELPYSDIDNNGVIDMIEDVQDVWTLLIQKGYQANTDMIYVQVEGGQHELSTWAEVLPGFLRFAFPV